MTDGTEKNYVDSVNNITEEEYKTSVQKSQEKAHDETMWGKPARDIVTGIGNNGGIRPVCLHFVSQSVNSLLVE